MALSKSPYKGTRDFFPEQMRLRNYIFSKMAEVSELFAYEPYDGPMIEELDLSFNDIGGHGVHSPDAQLQDSIRRLFEGEGSGFVPRLLTLENCGIGPSFCRSVGRVSKDAIRYYL